MKPPFSLLRFGYDTYERHRLIASLIENQKTHTILDVGGNPGLLTQFISRPVTVTNLSEGDVFSNGLFLPFADASFDIVTSLDVLEHLPRIYRPLFIAELIRVATLQVVFCTPLGSTEHSLREKEMLALLTSRGTSNAMLEEHLAFGIPSLQEIQAYIPLNTKSRFVFSGDFRFNCFLFQVDQSFGNVKVSKFIRFMIAVILNLVGNILIYPLYLSDQPREYTNRVTAVVLKNSNES